MDTATQTTSGAHGASVAAQFRWMRHGRTADGWSRHWLFGVMAPI